jgi:hypothetical protein
MKSKFNDTFIAGNLHKITRKLDQLRERLDGLETQKENPTVRANYYRCLGRLEALEAVKQALISGDTIDLGLL